MLVKVGFKANLNGRFADIYSGNETAAEKELETAVGNRPTSAGEVVFVWRRPGDRDLLTLKSLKIDPSGRCGGLRQTCFDEILQKSRQDAERYVWEGNEVITRCHRSGDNALPAITKQGKG